MKVKNTLAALLAVILPACSVTNSVENDESGILYRIPETEICFIQDYSVTNTTIEKNSKQVDCGLYENEALTPYEASNYDILVNGRIILKKASIGQGIEVESKQEGEAHYITLVSREYSLEPSSVVNGRFFNTLSGRCYSEVDDFRWNIKCLPKALRKAWWKF